MISHKPLRKIWSAVDTILIGILLLVTSILLGISIDVGEFWWTDESRHAMDGVYFLDLLKDRPFSNLYDYTVEYFVRYPALGFTWYPPFFAFIESLVFSVFGVSEISARLTVLLFCLVGISACYIWARPIWSSLTAFCACLFFIINTYVLLWGRSVMLEIPGVAMIMLSLLCFHYYLRRPTHTRSILTGLVIAGMLLTKQITTFILPVMIFYAILAGVGKRLLSPYSIWAYLVTTSALAILVIHAIKFGTTALGGFDHIIDSILSELIIEYLALNARVILAAYPLPLLLITIIGLTASILRDHKTQDTFIIVWIVVWYIFFTFMTQSFNNLLRYSIYLTPAMGFLAARALSYLPENSFYRKYGVATLIVLYAGYGYSGLRTEHLMVSGYDQAARFVLSQHTAGTVLFCCKHDGNFTFHIKRGDVERQHVVLRADKVLVSFVVHKKFGVLSYIHNEKEIYNLLDRYGVGTIVAENKDLVDLPEFKLLLKVLNGDKFEKLKEIDVKTNIQQFQGLKLNIYRYRDRKEVEGGEIVIPMPHIRRELRLRVD